VTLLGLDAFGHPPAQAVVDGGFSFVICYVGIPGNPKCVSAAQFEDYVAHGLRVGFVFESTAGRATEGFQAGQQDALAALAYIRGTLRVSVEVFPFYAVDADVTFSQVEPYFEGVKAVHEAGAYGDYQIVHALLNNNLVTEVWQTPAWSHGAIEPNAIVFQRIQTVDVGGVQCDVDEAAGYGLWAYPREQAVNQDDVNQIVNTLLDYPIQRQGLDQDGNPAQGTTSLRAILGWWDHGVTLPYRGLKPMMDKMLTGLADLSSVMATVKAGVPVQLADSDRQALISGLRQDVADAYKGAAGAFGAQQQ
jgi:hypothetical protein